jgi:glycerol-3-phosphate O-acyltransferase
VPKQYRDRAPRTAEREMAACMARRDLSFVFLPAPRRAHQPPRPRRPDPLRAAIAHQRANPDTPVYVVPHTLVDAESSGRLDPSILDRLLGQRRNPGFLRGLVMMLEGPLLQVAAAIDLRELCRAHPSATDEQLTRRLRHQLKRALDADERAVAGPELVEFATLERHVLRNDALADVMRAEAVRSARAPAGVRRRAAVHIREIAARYDVRFIRFMSGALTWIFSRIYDGLLVDEAGIRRVRQAARSGPLIFCPSHKSHIDYLVLSHVLWQHGLTPPHIAAGKNLSFFPMGFVFRRSGAFFMRRSFRGDGLYSALFRAYVHEVLELGTSLEFFLEGTRSRTGKVLMPRLGLLSMVVDAWRDGAQEDIQFMPVSIDYERVLEATTYRRELAGASKSAEGLGALLRGTKALGARYGRVHLQFGDPISLAQVARRAGLTQAPAKDCDGTVNRRWREETRRLGFRILRQVSTVCTITPTHVIALALLSHRGRAMTEAKLLRHADRLLELLDILAARFSPLLRRERRSAALAEALQRLAREKLVIREQVGGADALFHVPEDARVMVDFYKNSAMNHLAPVAIVARSLLLLQQEGRANLDDLETDTRFLSALLKGEFIYRVDATFDNHLADTLGTLSVSGIIEVDEDARRIVLVDGDALTLLSSTLDPFIESYWCTAVTLLDLRSFRLWERELRQRALEAAQRFVLEGTLGRPEAANRTLIDSAITYFHGAGVLEYVDRNEKTVDLTPEYAGHALEDLVDDLRRYVQAPPAGQ